MVEAEHDRVEVVRELVGLEVPAEVPGGHSGREEDSDHLEPAPLERDEAFPHRAGPVVELRRGGDEEAPAPPRVRLRPGEPPLEERGDARLAPWLVDRRPDHLVDEPFGGGVEDLDLEGLLGAEVREEPALGEPELGREPADRQALEADLGREPDGAIEDDRTRLLPFSHGQIRARTFVLCQDPFMNELSEILSLAGRWTGTYRLILDPSTPVRVSPTSATLSPVAGGRFARLDYDWGDEGKRQDGSLLVGFEKEESVATAVWVDSFHMSNKFMVCEGKARGGSVDVSGSYAAPPGPDWGWRTTLGPGPDGSLRMVMYNVTPDGEEYLAVEADYRRNS